MREKSGVEVKIQFGEIQESFFEEINQTEVWMTGENHPEKDMEGSGRVLGGWPSGRKEFGALKGVKCLQCGMNGGRMGNKLLLI